MIVTICLLLASIFTLWYLGVILYLLVGLTRLKPAGDPAGLRYSVVVAARNEEDNIGDCLVGILQQTIPASRYEVIVVNDRSTDATERIVREIGRNHLNLSLVNVQRTPPGEVPKKHAVLQGMAKAANDVIVLTDADCRVAPTWLASIDKCFSPDTGLVQGITAYRRVQGMSDAFFGFQAVDFLSHGIVSAAAIGAGLPLNSNANNLAFRRRAFDDVGGYGSQSNIVSGDDDLLLQRIWRSGKWKVGYMTDKRGAVETFATPTVAGVLDQRKRWGSVTVHYNPGQVILLSGIFLFYCSILLSFLAGFFNPILFGACVGLLAVKVGGELLLMMPGTRIFGRTELRAHIVPSSLIQLPLVLYAVLFGVFGRFNWKGREFERRIRAQDR
jgi:cellulose synthase/poly-beta-1,6-N-acetylglucosamine synthase-like glycosyltransferase